MTMWDHEHIFWAEQRHELGRVKTAEASTPSRSGCLWIFTDGDRHFYLAHDTAVLVTRTQILSAQRTRPQSQAHRCPPTHSESRPTMGELLLKDRVEEKALKPICVKINTGAPPKKKKKQKLISIVLLCYALTIERCFTVLVFSFSAMAAVAS